MPPLSEKHLEERLTAAGKSIAHPPTSLDELLPLLDRVEELLSKVEQSPPKLMQNVLNPLMKGLVSEVLLKHSDIDVKVGVASCISEITRITAPDAPYDDDTMKDVFQLIVSSFEDLSEVSSRSHEKRATILETVAKVRSCVIMLDLECDQMIIDMFQHFLKAIRAYHPEIIFGSMETIMTLVIEESEDISTDLLAPLLATLRRNNKNASPIARTLAERVIQNSANKLRPYLKQAVTFLETSLDDYSEVLASVCQENTDGAVNNNETKKPPVVEGKCSSASPAPDPETQAAEDDGEVTNFQDKDATAIGSPKSVVSNGINETGTNEITTEANASKRADSNDQLDANSTFKAESDDCDAQKPVQLEAKSEQAQQEAENHDTSDKDDHISPTEVKPVEADILDKEEDKSVEVVTELSKTVEALSEASPSQSGSHPEESLSETEIKKKNGEKLVDEEMVSVDTAPKKASEEESISEPKKQRRVGKKPTHDSAGKDKALTEEVASKNDDVCASDSEARSADQAEKPKDAINKKQRRLGKKPTHDSAGKEKALTEEVASKNDDGCASDSEARSTDQAEKPKDAINKTEHGSSVRKDDGKKSGRGKATSEKDTPKSAREDLEKDAVTPRKSQLKSKKREVQEETPRTSTKRKQTMGKAKASETPEFGKNLIGSKIKVWWPKDRVFYEGVIDSFDSVKKKHKVLYSDGDQEILNLKKEKWHFLEDDVVSNGDQDVEHSSDDTSSDVQVKRKGNISSETTSKRQKVEGSPKSKQRDTATKSGGKSKDDGTESESKENYLKPSKKSVDDKSKDQSQKLGVKGQVDSVKASGRSKEVVGKNSSNSKQDNLRTPKSKGKAPPAGKSVGSGSMRTKSVSSKLKETERVKEKTPDTGKSSETVKGKATDTSKLRESESKLGKKRRR